MSSDTDQNPAAESRDITAAEREDTPSEPAQEEQRGLRIGRTIIVAFVLLIIANLWVRQGALITLATQAAMAVPPVPALAALLLLYAGFRWLRRVGIGRNEMMGVYAMLTLAVALTSGAAMRQFLPHLVAPYYFASPENRFDEFFDYIPGWMVPHGEEIIRTYFEGTEAGIVPWGAWIRPLSIWLIFFVAFFGLLMCIALVFRPVWEKDEHLAYPMADLPLMLVGYRKQLIPKLWTNNLFWVGFGIICLHELLNILNAFNPAISALGMLYDLNPLFSEHPMHALQPLVLRYQPLVFGMTYFMPSDIVISTLFFYFIYLKGLSFYGVVTGIDRPQFPHRMKHAMGAMIGITLVVIYGARHRIANVFGRLTGRNEGSKVLPVALIVCAAVIFGFWLMAGMKWWIILAYYGLILSSAIGYMRGRAETGYPHHWIKPLDQERDTLIDFLGSERLAPGGNFASLTMLSMQHWMSRGYTPQLGAFPLEAFKMTGEMKIDVRKMVLLMMVAVVLGSVVSWWMHIDTAYDLGSNVLEGGTTAGGARVGLALQAYNTLTGWMRGHQEPDVWSQREILAPLFITIGLAVVRRIFIQFPLHPMGFVFAGTGAAINGWGMLALTQTIKSLTLRIGGMGAYNRLMPFFLGVIVGHMFAAGFVWGLLATFGGEGFDQYPVVF